MSSILPVVVYGGRPSVADWDVVSLSGYITAAQSPLARAMGSR